MKTTLSFRTLLLAGTALLLATGTARAIPPVYVSDAELAAHPVVVVARWDKAPFARPAAGVPKYYGAQTKLVVERVIRGDLEPGVRDVLLALQIGWGEDGGQVVSNTSTMMLGDVGDVCEPNLWFLRKEGDRLGAITYRAVQPLCLETYFAALGGDDPDTDVPALLRTSRDPETLRRGMKYVLGERSSWPHQGDPEEEKDARIGTSETAEAVAALLDGPVAEVRWNAATTYAALRGAAAHPRLRELLEDADPKVRAVAVGVLARARDRELIPRLSSAVAPIREGWWAMEVLEELEGWEDPGLVPGVAAFLDIDAFVYQMGDEIGVPVLLAQKILRDLTGHLFPPDPAAAKAAWAEVRGLPPEERLSRLARLAPWPSAPLEAEILPDGEGFVARVTNRSDRPVTITRLPSQVSFTASSGCSGGGLGVAKSADDFQPLKAGESVEFDIDLPAFIRGGENRRGFIFYRQIGTEWGKTAWIGKVPLVLPE